MLTALRTVWSTTLQRMSYSAAQGRQQILDALAGAAEQIGAALAELSEAYEHLDEHAAERLEEELFQPVRSAYGLAQRAHRAFAQRSGLEGGDFSTPAQVAPSSSPKALIERAVEMAGKADGALAGLQDSMLPVEVGDAELRSSLSQTRQLLAGVSPRGRELVRTLGR